MADMTAWYREKIKNRVTIKFQSHGGMLDGTMMGGDEQAGTVKFPVVNSQLTMYKLTGAIVPIPTTRIDVTTVPITMDDFELSAWWSTQDAYRAGPNEQEAASTVMVKAQRRKRDSIKLEALRAFEAADSGVTTIGTGAETPDLLHFEQARAEIAATGAESGGEDIDIYCPIPEMWASQLAFYKEWADADWVGTENMPFSKTQRMKTKTVRGVHYIVCPDDYFRTIDTTKLETFMWHKDSIGCETPVNQERVHMERDHTKEGSPYLMKNWLSGAAIGIQAAGVKQILLKKLTSIIRPPTPTIAV